MSASTLPQNMTADMKLFNGGPKAERPNQREEKRREGVDFSFHSKKLSDQFKEQFRYFLLAGYQKTQHLRVLRKYWHLSWLRSKTRKKLPGYKEHNLGNNKLLI